MRRPVALKAVTFDAGGTLISPHPSVGDLYARAARRRGIRAEVGDLERRFRAAWAARPRPFAVDPAAARSNWRFLVGRVFEGLAPPGAIDPLFDDLWGAFARPAAWRIRPGAAEAIARLHAAGWRTAVVSNWDDRLPGLLAALGLAAHLDAIVVSALVGREKPDPRIFEEACRRLGVAPAETVHIGDDAEEDLGGARTAGLDAILLEAPRREIADVVDLLYH